jgi:hypothetical protein
LSALPLCYRAQLRLGLDEDCLVLEFLKYFFHNFMTFLNRKK